jgi:hypothetical protein
MVPFKSRIVFHDMNINLGTTVAATAADPAVRRLDRLDRHGEGLHSAAMAGASHRRCAGIIEANGDARASAAHCRCAGERSRRETSNLLWF